MIKNLVFDMGNVLIRYSPQMFLDRFVKDTSYHTLLLREVFMGLEWQQTDLGSLSLDDAVARCCTRLPSCLHETVRTLFYNWSDPLLQIEGMEALLKRAKEKGYALYLLSNTSPAYRTFSKGIAGIEYMDGEFISCEWKMMKPDVRIYHLFCNHFGLVPAQSVFIDDSSANVLGAINAGMQGIVFHDRKQLEKALSAMGIDL